MKSAIASLIARTHGTDSRKVCDLHRKHHYDLILLDLLMPGMYGFQVIEGLREIETDGDLPVLVISAQPDYKMRAMQAGAKEFITKPLNRADVLTQVHNMLQARLAREATHGDRKAEEQAAHERSARLRESEELFRQFVISLPDSVFAAVHPDDLQRVLREAARLPNGGVDLECRVVRTDDALRWVHLRTFPIRDLKQQIVQVAGIMEDITGRESVNQS